MSNRRKTTVLNPGSGLRQRASWGYWKAKVQLRRGFVAQQHAVQQRIRSDRERRG